MIIRPMLGVNVNLDKLVYPLYASYKLDGIRALVVNGVVTSRSGKPIPNKYIQSIFSSLEGLDGELIVGSPNDSKVFSNTTSGVMSIEGTPDVTYFIFDRWSAIGGILDRYSEITNLYINNKHLNIKIVEQVEINNLDELLLFEQHALESGYEGIILRDTKASYKNGRSTIKEGALLKLKRFEDSEAEIVGVYCLLRNNNKATIDDLGYTSRSTLMDNKIPDDLLGAIEVKDINTGIQFSIGSGFTNEQRISLWNKKDKLKGLIVKYKYFAVGCKDKPRFPIFLGFRSKLDL